MRIGDRHSLYVLEDESGLGLSDFWVLKNDLKNVPDDYSVKRYDFEVVPFLDERGLMYLGPEPILPGDFVAPYHGELFESEDKSIPRDQFKIRMHDDRLVFVIDEIKHINNIANLANHKDPGYNAVIKLKTTPPKLPPKLKKNLMKDQPNAFLAADKIINPGDTIWTTYGDEFFTQMVDFFHSLI